MGRLDPAAPLPRAVGGCFDPGEHVGGDSGGLFHGSAVVAVVPFDAWTVRRTPSVIGDSRSAARCPAYPAKVVMGFLGSFPLSSR